jgi:hypothetical protein
MIGSPSSIVSFGLGSWASPSDIVTLGYGIGAAVLASAANIYRRNIIAVESRNIVIHAEARRLIVKLEDRDDEI